MNNNTKKIFKTLLIFAFIALIINNYNALTKINRLEDYIDKMDWCRVKDEEITNDEPNL
jgi:hypothetical protein